MVVRIRLSRWGSKGNPFYGITVANARSARDKGFLEKVGTYNSVPDEFGKKHIQVNVKRIKYWLSVGAIPSDRVHWLLSKLNLVPPHPKMLQKNGVLSLTDPKTWDVAVHDESGNQLEILPSIEAREIFMGSELEKDLPRDDENMIQNALEYPLTSDAIDLSKPVKPDTLTDNERLLLLKTYLNF